MIGSPGGPDTGVPQSPEPHPRPVERERELALLTDLLRQTAAGRPGLVVLEGPDGIGKSTLLRALTSEARSAGVRVLEARCDPARRGHSFDMVRQLLGRLPETGTGPGRGPSWITRPPVPAHGARPGASPCCPPYREGDISYGMLLALHRALRLVADDGPVLLAVDDAQCADLASLRFLAHAARRLSGMPVLLVVSRRTGVEAAPLDEVAAQPMCHILRPRPLSDNGVGQVARDLTGDSGGQDFQRACLAATNGNPLLVTRLLSGLRHDGQPLTAAGLDGFGGQDVPLFTERVIRVLRQQSARTLRAVWAMAVLGDGTSTESCARLALLDATVFARSLLTLRSIGVVSTTLDGRTWSFAHPLVRQAVLSDMPAPQRAAARRRAARLLHDSGSPAREVAEHLRLAGTPVVERWAVGALREAAREATLRRAYAHAADLLGRCVPDDAAAGADPDLLAELGLAEAHVDARASIRHLRLALRHTTNPERRLTVLSTLAGGLVRTGEVAKAVSLLKEYEGSVDSRGGGTARLLEAQILLASTGNRRSLTDLLDEVSFDLGLPGGTPGERALLATRAVISVARGERMPEAVAAARTVAARGMPTTDTPAFLTTAASALLYADRPGEAHTVLRRLIGAAEAHDELSYPHLLAFHADACRRVGRLGEALDATAEALELRPPERGGAGCALPTAVRVHTLLDGTDTESADAVAARAQPPSAADAWQWNEFLCARGRLRLAAGDPEAALADLLECGRRDREWQRINPAVSSWWYWAGHAHLALGNGAPAGALAEEAVALARSADLPSALGTGLELLAAVRGAQAGRPLLEEAQAVLEETSTVLDLIRVRVAHGNALHSLGHTQAAREVLRRGLETAYAHGARPLYRLARQALLATGARPRRPMSSGLGSLTPSEAQVARLAADGQSNAEIAEALFVTQRTVEVHLTSVYRKLGLSGRRELRGALDGAGAGEAASVPAGGGPAEWSGRRRTRQEGGAA